MKQGKVRFASGCSLTVTNSVLRDIYANLEFFRSKILLRPQEITNSPEIVRRIGIISVNTAIEVEDARNFLGIGKIIIGAVSEEEIGIHDERAAIGQQQVLPDPHATPQLPQLRGSVAVAVQTPSQIDWPRAQGPSPQMP